MLQQPNGITKNEKGHKTAIFILIRIRKPMSPNGIKRWGRYSRTKIERWVWITYATSKDFIAYFPETKGAIPVEWLSNEKNLIAFIFKYLFVDNGDHLAIQGFTRKKTRTGVGFTPHLVEIRIQNVEQEKAEILKAIRIRRYWFWEKSKQKGRGMRLG